MSWLSHTLPAPPTPCIELIMYRCPYCGTHMALPRWYRDTGCHGYCPSCCAGPFVSDHECGGSACWDYLAFVDGSYATRDMWPPEESC